MQTLNIATWNILSDKGGFFTTESQAERLGSITQTLANTGLRLDVVGLLEVENDQQPGHHGQKIAQNLAGVDGHWTRSSLRGEDLGMFGESVDIISTHRLVADRSMMVARVGEFAVGLAHFTFDMMSDRVRSQQATQALAYMAEYDKAILMGDFNSASWQRSRKIIESEGFQSVFQVLERRRPATIMTEKYRQRLSKKLRLATKYGFSPDDIYVRGLDVNDAGVFEGDSDHRGVWAQVTG